MKFNIIYSCIIIQVVKIKHNIILILCIVINIKHINESELILKYYPTYLNIIIQY